MGCFLSFHPRLSVQWGENWQGCIHRNLHFLLRTSSSCVVFKRSALKNQSQQMQGSNLNLLTFLTLPFWLYLRQVYGMQVSKPLSFWRIIWISGHHWFSSAYSKCRPLQLCCSVSSPSFPQLHFSELKKPSRNRSYAFLFWIASNTFGVPPWANKYWLYLWEAPINTWCLIYSLSYTGHTMTLLLS